MRCLFAVGLYLSRRSASSCCALISSGAPLCKRAFLCFPVLCRYFAGFLFPLRCGVLRYVAPFVSGRFIPSQVIRCPVSVLLSLQGFTICPCRFSLCAVLALFRVQRSFYRLCCLKWILWRSVASLFKICQPVYFLVFVSPSVRWYLSTPARSCIYSRAFSCPSSFSILKSLNMSCFCSVLSSPSFPLSLIRFRLAPIPTRLYCRYMFV